MRRSALAIHTSALFNHPIWLPLFCFFFLLQQRKKKSLDDFKGSFDAQRPPHPHPLFSCCGSKDGGYADCQLGVPTSAISTQRKTDVSKGNPEESAVLWRGHKMFYAAGLQRGDIAAFAGTFWRTKCYFKGSQLTYELPDSRAECRLMILSKKPIETDLLSRSSQSQLQVAAGREMGRIGGWVCPCHRFVTSPHGVFFYCAATLSGCGKIWDYWPIVPMILVS